MKHEATGGRIRVAARAIVLVAGLFLAGTLDGAEIAGTVRDGAKEPVPNATVVAVNLTPSAADALAPAAEKPVARTQVRVAVTGFGGDFAFGDLPAGHYRICVEKRHALLLNPCEWAKPTEVTLGDAQAAEKVEIAVSYGKAVRVRIDDPEEALTGTKAAKSGDVLVGIAVLDPDGVLHDVRPLPKDRKGQGYEIVVPAETELQLVVNSRNAEFEQSVAAEQKTKLNKNHARIPLRVEANATVEKVLRLEMRREKK